MRSVLYTGKGGVGKTTTAAATAVRAAERGTRTLVVSADAAHSLGDVLGQRLGPEPVAITPTLYALEVDARVELGRHWGRIHDYLVALFRYQGIEEIVAEELALLPGAEEITSLLAIEAHAEAGGFELVVVDCAPTDTTLRLATLPEVAHAALRLGLKLQRTLAAVVTPLARHVVPMPLPDAAVFGDVEKLIYETLSRLRERLTSDETSVRLVVTPERMVIDEARRAFTELSLFELACDAVIVNRVLPGEATDEDFFREWGRVQAERIAEVTELFAPLRCLFAPLQPDEVIGLGRLAHHGRALFGEEDPAAWLSSAPRIRFVRERAGYRVHLRLPGATPDRLDVVKVGGELIVRAGGRRRALELPGRMAHAALAGARLEGDELVVSFVLLAPPAGRA